MAEAQDSGNTVDEEITAGKELTLDKEFTLENILAIHDGCHNKTAIHRILMEYYDSLQGGDATSPEVREIIERAMQLDTSTAVYSMAIEHSIMNLRELRGGIRLPATIWNMFDKNGITLKATDDSRISEVEKLGPKYCTVTFKVPVDWNTAVDILKGHVVFMAFGK